MQTVLILIAFFVINTLIWFAYDGVQNERFNSLVTSVKELARSEENDNEIAVKIPPDIIQEYLEQAKQRIDFFSRDWPDNNMFNVLAPEQGKFLKCLPRNLADFFTKKASHDADHESEAICPGRIRLGSIYDGGKWICNPGKLPEGCNIFSLGLNGEVSFDRAIQEYTNKRCRIFGYEQNGRMLLQSTFNSINGKSSQVTLSKETNKSKNESTISDLMKSEGIASVELLKIDIEGAEFNVLIPFLEKNTVCQILIEIHGTVKKVVGLLKMMSLHGYLLFHYEINPGGNLMATEFSLIQESCLAKYGAVKLAKYLRERKR